MDAKQFFKLVTRMREAQKLYFKTRASAYLQESKSLERQVDKEIERVQKIKEQQRSPKLF